MYDPRETSDASSFIYKDPRETFALQEPYIDLFSTIEPQIHQQKDSETFWIQVEKSECESVYQNFQINDKSILVENHFPKELRENLYLKPYMVEHFTS